MSFPQDLIAKYPSLKKFEELGDKYEEWKDGREAQLLNYIYSSPDLPSFRNNPPQLLARVDQFAAQEDFLINIGSDKAATVADLIAAHKPAILVELGGYLGYSAIWFGAAMRAAAQPGVRVQLVSLEAEPLFAAIAMSLVDLAGLNDVVKVVTGPADASLKRLVAEGALNHIDMLFLDHLEDLYERDFKLCEELNLFRPGSLVVADNVVRPGAPEYRAYVRVHPQLDSEGVRGLIMPGEFEDELEVSLFK